MSQSVLIQARIAPETKSAANAVLSEMGLSISDLIRLTLENVAKNKTLPFELEPNEETKKAMAEIDAGGGERFENVNDFFEAMGI